MKYIIIFGIVAGLLVLAFIWRKTQSGFPQPIPAAKEIEYETTRVVIDDAVIDGGDVQQIIDPVYWPVDIYHDEETYRKGLEPFSDPQRYVFAIMWYQAEVCNGGHDQFYFNSTGIVWKDVLEGFEAIGLTDCHAIMAESVKRMGGSPSKDRKTRQQQLDALSDEAFDDLDTRFFELERTNVCYDTLVAYIKQNREDFYFDGMVRKPKGM